VVANELPYPQVIEPKLTDFDALLEQLAASHAAPVEQTPVAV
jgi:hypothetical protein